MAVFDDSLARLTDNAATVVCSNNTFCAAYQNRETGQQLLTVWDRSGVPSDTNALVSARITVKGCTIKDPVWVDLISGRIYAFPNERVTREGDVSHFRDVPVYDAPVLLAEKSLVLR